MLARLLTEAPGVVSVSGSGGKTSFLFAFGEALTRNGRQVILTTTTRMLRPLPADWLSFRAEPGKALFLSNPPQADQDQTKVYGFAPERINELRRQYPDSWILVETDGSACRPLKAPAAHEPVVPASTTHAVALVGLSGVNRPFSDETVFRHEHFAAVTGLRPGDIVTPAALVKLIHHPEGMFKNVPAGAKKYVFCNQSDLPGAMEAGEELAGLAQKNWPGFLDGFFVGSLWTKGTACTAFPTN